MSKKKDGDESSSKRVEYKDLDYSKCSKHGLSYPKGTSCPKCVAESKQSAS
jgi:hypothetical protein